MWGTIYMRLLQSLSLSLIFCFSNSHANVDIASAEPNKWSEWEETASVDEVSEGELRFITQQPDKPVLHSLNKLVISAASLDDGWVSLEQCYQHLDPVAASEVVYQYKEMLDLKITKTVNIIKAEIKGQSIELTQVLKDAELCISASVRIFYQNADGSYSLVNGPFLRKFLDGYFPYHVTLEVHYPESRIQLIRTKPTAQAGVLVRQQRGTILLNCLFEGILNVELVFQPRL